ncbi:MAG: PEP-utilizing enzyme [Acidimicrobiales bacterium]
MSSFALVDLGVGPYVNEQVSSRFPVYTRGNAGEVWPEVVYPLSISLTRTFDDPVSAAMVKTGLVTEAELIEGSGCAAGVFGGYMYLNLSLSRVLAVRSPGVSIEDNDATYLGSEGIAPAHLPNKADRSVRASANAVRYMIGVLRTRSLDELRADQLMVAEWKRRVPKLIEASDEELLKTIRSLIPVGMGLFSRHLEVTGKAGASVQFLSAFCEKQLGDRVVALSLLSSIGDVDSAAPSYALWALGREVAASPDLTKIFDQGLSGLAERVNQIAHDEFNDKFAMFLDEFGARGPNEWETASETWGTEPRLALALIDRLRLAEEKQDPAARSVGLTTQRQGLTASSRARVKWLLRKPFDRALAVATLFSAGRERSKTTVVELIHVSRVLSRELAGRAATRTEDGHWEDMWFCLADELDAYVDDPGPFAERIAARRATRQALSGRIPPFVFEGEMPPVMSWPLRSEVQTEDVLAVGDSIKGLAAVPGIAEGRACVVTDPFDPGDLGPGDVLIAPLTDPAWTPLFVAAEAVVVDVGCQMSHAVIVAREFGMPCVVAAADATKRIPHGSRVRVDATNGTVTLIES